MTYALAPVQLATQRFFITLMALLLLSGCAIQLVPDYDPALHDGLNEANEETLILFAKLDGGSDQSEYPQFRDDYAGLIGRFDAMRLRGETRYIPPLASKLAKQKVFRAVCKSGDDPTSCLNASPKSLEVVVRLLRKLRDDHRQRGLSDGDVKLTRAGYNPAIQQALKVESALQR